MKNCLHCNQLTKNEKFCSRPCAASYNNRVQPKRAGENNCLQCNAVISTRKTWCSETCKIKMKSDLKVKQSAEEYTCNYCLNKLPAGEFYMNSKYKCKSCTIAYMSQRKRDTKQKLIDEAGGACARCGYAACRRALHFHHVNPNEKEFIICDRISRGISTLRDEAGKCILLCANCHFEKHDGLW